jgi:hypothetical protein
MNYKRWRCTGAVYNDVMVVVGRPPPPVPLLILVIFLCSTQVSDTHSFLWITGGSGQDSIQSSEAYTISSTPGGSWHLASLNKPREMAGVVAIPGQGNTYSFCRHIIITHGGGVILIRNCMCK